MDDRDQSVLQGRCVVDEVTQVQILRERDWGSVFAPAAVDSGEAVQFEYEDFGCGGEAGDLHVCCRLVTAAAMSG